MNATAGSVTSFDYAPALEPASLVQLRPRYGLFVGGQWVSAEQAATFVTVDPSSEAPLAEIACAQAADVDRAVRAARRGYDKYWRKLRSSERAKYLYRLARIVGERSRELSIVETIDTGKPVRETREFDIAAAAAVIFYYAGWADKLEWAVRAPERARALGVVGAIVSSRFPLLMACWKIAPTLASGNTIVIKPAETTPLSALWLAEIVAEADLPPGVVNVVSGDARTGAALAEHPDLDKLSFTGGTDIGKQLRRDLAGSRTRLALALDGRSPAIVFDDAPLDQAIEGIVNAIFLNRGRVSSAGSRLLVQESIADDVAERLRERLDTLRIGNPLDKNTDFGPATSRGERDRIVEHVRAGHEDGGTFVAHAGQLPEPGFFYAPGFFTGLHGAHTVSRDGPWSPVPVLTTFRTPDEALEHANDSPFGLAAGVWTSSGALALYAAQRLRAGVVWADTYNRFDPSAPFGGYKESGIGREGGVVGLRAYLDT